MIVMSFTHYFVFLTLILTICFLRVVSGVDTKSVVDSISSWLFSSEDACPYHPEPYTATNKSLSIHIHGQSIAVDTIMKSIGAWELSTELSEPLIFAFTGPTGCGKSETAYRLAEALLTKRVRRGTTAKFDPKGLLSFRGEDFSNTSDLAMTGGIGEIQQIMRTRIVNHLDTCNGNGVIVFDEVQKIIPGALEFLLSALDDRGTLSITEYVSSADAAAARRGVGTIKDAAKSIMYGVADATGVNSFLSSTPFSVGSSSDSRGSSSKRGSSVHEWERTQAAEQIHLSRADNRVPYTRQVSTSNAAFIFISDIGAERMNALLLSYGTREAIPLPTLRMEVKEALDDQWARLRFGKTIKAVVPFLPLEPTHVKRILHSKLKKLSDTHRLSFWHQLIVDDDVVQYLIGPTFIHYDVHKTNVVYNEEKVLTQQDISSATSFATGAAIEETCSGQQLCAGDFKGAQGGGGGGEGSVVIADCSDGSIGESIANSGSGNGCTSGSSTGTKMVPRRKVFARYGARALENSGPLLDLKGLIYKHMKPWKPGHILHIGFLVPEHEELYFKRWGRPTTGVSTQPKERVRIMVSI